MSKQLELTVKIDANGNINSKLKEVVSGVDSVNSAVKNLTGTQAQFGNISDQFYGKTQKGLQSVSEQLATTKTQFLAYVAAVVSVDTAQRIIATADAYNAMQGQLALVTTTARELATVQQQLNQVSMAAYANQAATVKLYASMQPALSDMGKSTAEVVRFTELFNKSLSLTAPITSESQAAILQFAQAMGSGVLRGDEFNSMMENGRGVMNMLAEGMGKPIGELRALAEQGKLTSDVVYNALVNASDSIQANFDKMPLTVGKAMTNLETGFLNLVGGADAVTGATSALANAINSTANGFMSASGVLNDYATASAFADAQTQYLSVSLSDIVNVGGSGVFTTLLTETHKFSLAVEALAYDLGLVGATALSVFTGDFKAIPLIFDEYNASMVRLTENQAQFEAKLKSISEAKKDMRSATEMLLEQEKGMGTQLEMLSAQNASFGLSVEQTSTALGVYSVATNSAKESSSGAKDIIKGLQEQYALLTLSTREAAIAKSVFSATDKGATASEIDYIKQQSAAIFDLTEKNKSATTAVKAYGQAVKQARKDIKSEQDAEYAWFENDVKAIDGYNKQVADKARQLYESTRTPFERLNADMAEYDQLLASGSISFDTYSRAVFDAYEKASDAGKNFTDEQKNNMRDLQQAIDGWGKDSARAIADFALSGKASFGDFAQSVIKDLMQMMIYQNMTKPLMSAAGSWMSSLFNGGMNWSSGNAVVAAQNASFNANGNAFTGVGIQAFANGGTFTNSIVNSPTAFKFANGGQFNLGVMGEAGPEAVMPLTRIGGKLGVLAQGVGSGNGGGAVTVNVINNAGDSTQATASQRTDSQGNSIIDVMIEQVKGALSQDVAYNGSFSQSLSSAYGLTRRAF